MRKKQDIMWEQREYQGDRKSGFFIVSLVLFNNSLYSPATLINDESTIGTALIMLHLVFCLHWKKDAPKLAFSVSDQP